MNHLEKILGATIIAICLCACETTTSEDGTRTTRWDADATTKGINEAFNVYDRVRQAQQPLPRIVGYNQLGQPIYSQP